jgi:DNA-directed RNA polymerase subunit E'/Rpb7
LDVKRVIKIEKSYISDVDSNVIFSVQIEIEALKPDTGDVLNGVVSLVSEHGILVNIPKANLHDKIMVLIPVNNMKSYKYVEKEKNGIKEGCYEKDKLKIVVGNEIKVKIQFVRYEKQCFSYIGNLEM